MIDRVDLLIAVIAIAVSAVGSSIAFGMAISKKAYKEDLLRLEQKIDALTVRVTAEPRAHSEV